MTILVSDWVYDSEIVVFPEHFTIKTAAGGLFLSDKFSSRNLPPSNAHQNIHPIQSISMSITYLYRKNDKYGRLFMGSKIL
jgi:hypothetical protein